jgi:alpha-1,6-mannosyltransferase
VKLNRPLSGIALLLATFLSVALAYLGTSKFYYLLAGGRKFPTFPNLYWQLGIGLSYLLLSFLYIIWVWHTVDRVPPKTTGRFSNLLLRASVFLGLAFISYPLGNDIYIYLHTGLMNLSGANPFLVRAAAFMSELSPYVDWGQTSTYGPVSQILFTISSVFLVVHPLLAVYVFKAICLVFHVVNAFLLWKWLPSQDQEKITSFYLLHPLLLVEQVGSAHIDILVSTSLILFALSFARQRFWSAFGALWFGFLSKTLPILWAPLVALSFLRLGRWKLLIKMILASGAIALILSVLALPSVTAWRSLLNPGVAGQLQSSLHAIARFGLDLVRIFLPDWITPAESGEILITLNQMMLLGFLCFYAWRLWRSDRYWKTTPRTLIEEMGWVTLVLMLFATPWLMPWYCSVPLTFAALIPRARLFGITSLAFGLSSSAQYVLLNNSSLKSSVSIGLPIAAFLIGLRVLNQSSDAEEIALSDRLSTSRLESNSRQITPLE